MPMMIGTSFSSPVWLCSCELRSCIKHCLYTTTRTTSTVQLLNFVQLWIRIHATCSRTNNWTLDLLWCTMKCCTSWICNTIKIAGSHDVTVGDRNSRYKGKSSGKESVYVHETQPKGLPVVQLRLQLKPIKMNDGNSQKNEWRRTCKTPP
jgi:hypothetical protein